jgi:hypothetical protein
MEQSCLIFCDVWWLSIHYKVKSQRIVPDLRGKEHQPGRERARVMSPCLLPVGWCSVHSAWPRPKREKALFVLANDRTWTSSSFQCVLYYFFIAILLKSQGVLRNTTEAFPLLCPVSQLELSVWLVSLTEPQPDGRDDFPPPALRSVCKV